MSEHSHTVSEGMFEVMSEEAIMSTSAIQQAMDMRCGATASRRSEARGFLVV